VRVAGFVAVACLTLVGVWGLSTLSVIADDADRCVNATGRDGIAACDRVIASGKFGGSRLAFAYYNRGLAKLEMGDYDRAIADFDAAIRLDPASAAAFNNRGGAWYAKGDQDRAIADFDKAIQLDPACAFAYHNRGEVWRDKGDFNRAIADYGKAIELDRAYTAAYTDRALAYEHIGDLTRAREDFRAALGMSAKYSDGERAQATAQERLAALGSAEPRPPTAAIAGAPAAWPGQPGATQSAPPASAPVKPWPSAAPQAVVPMPGISPVDAGAPVVAQQVAPAALVVNGEAITNDDIDQRTKFNALANHTSPSRKDVIEELIDDKLKTGIARRYKIDLTDKDVDAQYADMAKRMHITADELTQTLGTNGVGDKTLKAKILADLSWQYVIRRRLTRRPQLSEQQVSRQSAGSEAAHQTKGQIS
jgi:tetratricopeptide (TPR) repeat protein